MLDNHIRFRQTGYSNSKDVDGLSPRHYERDMKLLMAEEGVVKRGRKLLTNAERKQRRAERRARFGAMWQAFLAGARGG